jgi:acyl-CoA reductase-like NAD-dependent aldehyde dehydrogenase
MCTLPERMRSATFMASPTGPMIETDSPYSEALATLTAGAVARTGADHDGLFYRPTVLTDVTPDMPAWSSRR